MSCGYGNSHLNPYLNRINTLSRTTLFVVLFLPVDERLCADRNRGRAWAHLSPLRGSDICRLFLRRSARPGSHVHLPPTATGTWKRRSETRAPPGRVLRVLTGPPFACFSATASGRNLTGPTCFRNEAGCGRMCVCMRVGDL